MHSARGLLEPLSQRGRAELQYEGAGVPLGGVGSSPSSLLSRGDLLHGVHGPRGAQVDVAHGRCAREAGAVAVAFDGV